jgi:hypothetical protein
MLKMKEPPGMCMKTLAAMTKCPAKYSVFTRNCTNCPMIGTNPSDFWDENAGMARLLEHCGANPQSLL